MLRKFTVLILLPLFCTAITITRDSAPAIVIGGSARIDEKTAADDIRNYLERITGAACQIVEEGAAMRSSAIYVGDTDFARRHVPNYGKLQAEELVIKTEGADLIICGGRPRGCIYAAWEFLEREGVAWPSEDCDYAPRKDSIVLDDVYVRRLPAIQYRVVYTGLNLNHARANSFFCHNRANMHFPARPEFGGSYRYGTPGQCHTFHAYSSPEWPDEYFALDSQGRRPRSTSGSGPGQLCTTHPEVRKAMAKRLREFIAQDRKGKSPEEWPTIYSISHNDNSVYCHCDRCQALAEREESQAALMLSLVNELARGIAEEYPEIRLYMLAYTWALPVTKNMKPEPNVIMHTAKLDCEFAAEGCADVLSDNTHRRNKFFLDNFMAWSRVSPLMGVGDFWITCYTKPYHPPYLSARNVQKDIAFYTENNVAEMMVECEAPEDTMFTHFRWWFGLKMMQDPYQPMDALAGKFCRAFYGPAAEPMHRLMDYLQDREEKADIAIGTAKFIKNRARYVSSSSKGMDDVLPYLDLEFYTKANALLDEAESLADGNPLFLEHVRMERMPVDICLLNTVSKYSDALPVGNRIRPSAEALFQRICDGRMARVRHFHDGRYYPLSKDRISEEESKLADQRVRLFDAARNLPPGFQGRETVVYNAADIKKNSHGPLVPDPDAPGGKASLLKESNDAGYHKLPFNMGFCIRRTSNAYHTNLKQPDIFQDGKYHLYHLGRHKILPNGCVWMHWTWLVQCYVDDVYRKDEDNLWDIYASVKFLGEPYVAGSGEAPRVLVDQIILAK